MLPHIDFCDALFRSQLSGDGGNNQKSALQQTIQQQCDPTDRPKPPRCERPIIVHHRLAGWALFLYFCATALYYFHIRYTRTLNMGYYGCACVYVSVVQGRVNVCERYGDS